MTSIYDDLNRNIAVTVIEVEPCVITQVKTLDNDGYSAIQLAGFDKKPKNVSNALIGHFDKAGAAPKQYIAEFDAVGNFELGDMLNIEDVLQVGDLVDVVGTSKGKGFTGAMKRHNFAGVGEATHGQHDRQRSVGAIGNASDPSRVFKGKKMPGRSGNERVKSVHLTVAKILPESNMVLITGSIAGPNGGFVEIHKQD